MVGQLYVPGEAKVLSGIYFRRTNIGTNPVAGATTGRVAAVFRASWGAQSTPQLVYSLGDIGRYYGTGLGTDITREALYGRAPEILAMRVGADGVKGSRTLVDTTGGPINVVTLPNRYTGDRAIYTTVRNAPDGSANRELLAYELIGGVYTLLETIRFASGAGGGGEPQKLVDAVNGVTPGYTASKWLGPAVRLAAGNGIMAAYTQQAQAGGANPASLAADYSVALGVLSTYAWDVLIVDTVDTTILASVKAYVDTLETQGILTMASVAQPVATALATTQGYAGAYNDYRVVYTGNGFVNSATLTRDGFLAAARMGGMIAATPSNQSITWLPVFDAVSIYGPMDADQQSASKLNGLTFFKVDQDGNVIVGEGITTFRTATSDLDLGWSKIRRVRARDEFMRRVGRSWARVHGRLTNNREGRRTLLGYAQQVGGEMIHEQKLGLVDCFEDAAYPPAGDTATFIAAIVDLDSLERVYMAFGFQFGGQSVV